VLSFCASALKGDIMYNRFLSKYWVPNVSRLMRILRRGLLAKFLST